MNVILSSIKETNRLTHFMPLISFDTPWKYQKTSDFPSDVSRGYQKRSVAWNGLIRKEISTDILKFSIFQI